MDRRVDVLCVSLDRLDCLSSPPSGGTEKSGIEGNFRRLLAEKADSMAIIGLLDITAFSNTLNEFVFPSVAAARNVCPRLSRSPPLGSICVQTRATFLPFPGD